jgi:ArsR family transcriptional regulator
VQTSKAIKIFESLGQERRLEIYKLLLHSQKGMYAGDIAKILNIPPATLSFHLNSMINSGLLKSERRSRFVIYKAKKKIIANLLAYLETPLALPQTLHSSIVPDNE